MARKTTAKRGKRVVRTRAVSPANPAGSIDDAGLTKGELRKLTALRKSLGNSIANRAFAQWLRQKAGSKAAPPVDRNAQTIADALEALAKAGKLRIPRGGYLVRRGRGRVIVARARAG